MPRTKLVIDGATVTRLRRQGLSWSDIFKHLNRSKSAFWKWHKEIGYYIIVNWHLVMLFTNSTCS
jgi:hypothetical protein